MDLYELMYNISELGDGFFIKLGLVFSAVSAVVAVYDHFFVKADEPKANNSDSSGKKKTIGSYVFVCASVMTVVLLWGSFLVQVPDVIGYHYEDARQILIDHNLKYSGSVDTNAKITEQNPVAGEIVRPRSIIELVGETTANSTVSESEKETEYPDNTVPEHVEPIIDLQPGDTLTFGSYEQDNNFNNGTELIDWLVLERKEDRILIISQYGLDCAEYDDQDSNDWSPEPVSWETSSMRDWLNNTFYKAAFDEDEKAQIVSTVIDDTSNKIFILSADELIYHFPSNAARICIGTDYAISHGTTVTPKSWWWLRSTEKSSKSPSVNTDGSIDYNSRVNGQGGTVRPVLWLDIE